MVEKPTYEAVKAAILSSGALAAGISCAEPVDDKAWTEYESWIASGRHAGMGYITEHREVRRDPRLLLEGARWIISIAYGYHTDASRNREEGSISAYALLKDYHNWIKKRLRRCGIGTLLGEEHRDWRICVDSAPVMERYWAVKSGMAVRGKNGSAIVPGAGCEVFLAEIVTGTEISEVPAAGEETHRECADCGRCLRACPTGALQGDGTIDCDRCISYLTIEHRGEWVDPRHIESMDTKAGRDTLFGCDRCIEVCPMNSGKVSATAEELTLPGIVDLTRTEILDGEDTTLRLRLQGSSLKRAGLEGLRRNAMGVRSEKGEGRSEE